MVDGVFLSGAGLLEAGEESNLKVKRAASLALCLRPRVSLSATPRLPALHGLHGHPFNSSCRAFGCFQVNTNTPELPACWIFVEGNAHF